MMEEHIDKSAEYEQSTLMALFEKYSDQVYSLYYSGKHAEAEFMLESLAVLKIMGIKKSRFDKNTTIKSAYELHDFSEDILQKHYDDRVMPILAGGEVRYPERSDRMGQEFEILDFIEKYYESEENKKFKFRKINNLEEL